MLKKHGAIFLSAPCFLFRNLEFSPDCVIRWADYPKKLNSTPAATAEPITPATFGPMACIRR